MSHEYGWTTQPAQAGPSQPRNGQQFPGTPFTPHATTPLMSHNQPDMSHGMLDELQPDPEPSPSPPVPGLGQLVEPHQGLNEFLESFWTRQMEFVEKDNPDFRTYPLPLARIKKVMKSDEEVKMISAEAPILFSKACELFISELTCRAWLIAESKKRRTLQKSDVAAAIALSDMFDFLIDILPRDDDGNGEVDGSGANGGAGQIDTGLEGDEGGLEGEEGDEDGEERENGTGQYIQEG